MQAVGVILFLISVATIAAPVGAVVYMYRDNLIQVVIPPEFSDMISNTTETILSGGELLAPVFVDSQVDVLSRTFSVTVNFTNNFFFNLTLKDLSGTVVCADHNYVLGNVSLSETVEILAGETAQITVTGAWTEGAENHVLVEHLSVNTINVNLVNLAVNVNEIIVEEPGPISVGEIPLR